MPSRASAPRSPGPPVLFCTEDSHLLLVSRYRHRLKSAFRFVLSDERLIEDLVDKARFHELAGTPAASGAGDAPDLHDRGLSPRAST